MANKPHINNIKMIAGEEGLWVLAIINKTIMGTVLVTQGVLG